MRKLFLFILLIFLLGACNPYGKRTNEVDSNFSATNPIVSEVQIMPKNMPDDFGFSIQFGVTKKNQINTFKGTVTKDLITAGTVTADISLTEEEMNDIYEKMKEIKIIETKRLKPETIECVQEPYEEDEWEITVDGETIKHSVSGTYCEPTNDAQQLIDLRKYIFSIIKEKEKYKELPASEGGYE